MSGIGRLRAAVVSVLLLTATVFCVATARAMPPLEIYGNLPGLEMAAISPSGNHVAILGRVGTDRKVLLLDQGSKLIRHVSVGDIKIRGLYWAGDEMLLIERSNTTVLGPSFTANKAVGSGRDLSAVSPIRHAERADAPVLLIHGKDDTVVLYDQSNDMGDALRRAGKPVEMVTLDGEDHWLSRSETRLAMLKAALAFVEKHNPPGPVPTR